MSLKQSIPTSTPGEPLCAGSRCASTHGCARQRTPRRIRHGAILRCALLVPALAAVLLWLAPAQAAHHGSSAAAGRGRAARAHAAKTLGHVPGAQAQIFIDRMPTGAELAHRYSGAKFEPIAGCYLGAFIDFDPSVHQTAVVDRNHTLHKDPTGFERIVKKSHAMYFFYMGYGTPVPIEWLRWLASRDYFVHIALEPNAGLSRVRNDAYLAKLADDLKASGARIFLRFASEMNGDWTNYHKDPKLYRAKFRLVHAVMRRRAPNVAMVWCPYMEPTYNIDSYYPGDDATDWVGVNLYNVTYHDNHLSLPAEKEHPCDLLNWMYGHYAARKPIMICEFGATHWAACEKRVRSDFAVRKILTLYTALPRLYPRVKCINYFDSNNMQYAAGRAFNDYSVTDDEDVVVAYRAAVASPYFLTGRGDDPPGDRPIPMPCRPNEILRGRVRLSCWARGPSDIVSVRYRLDGFLIYKAWLPDAWECIWDSSSVRPGPHTLTLEVRSFGGQVVASQSLPVQIVR